SLRVPRRAILLPQDPRRVPRDSAMNPIFPVDCFAGHVIRTDRHERIPKCASRIFPRERAPAESAADRVQTPPFAADPIA
ncbi:hypothetical protein, partial [Burkholderia thailandensis]|uniref:hypothetical protein n=2 Tax=Burkholderia thailandensis TaxID=57975 RepID=UPI001E2FD0E8